MSDLIHFSSVADRWWNAVRDSPDSSVTILSPFLTSDIAESVLSSSNAESCRVFTCLDLRSFASGASSIDTIERLLKVGVQVFHLPEIHAKVLIVGSSFMGAGSQNPTKKGTMNKEATAAIIESERIKKAVEILEGG